jgi:hypothetical protein
MQRWFQIRKSDPLDQQARDLVPAAHSLAIGLTKFRSQFACLQAIDDQSWDFFVTVAGVFVASTRLRNLKIGSKREDRLMEIASQEFQKWHPRAIEGFEDCKAFFDRTYDAISADSREDERQFVSSDTIGGWIAWSALAHPPETPDERAFARQIGVVVTHELFSWWDS